MRFRQTKITHKVQCPSTLIKPIDDAITYWSGVNPVSGKTSTDLLRDLCKERYGRYIGKSTNPDDLTTGLEMVTDAKTGVAIDAGIYEAIHLGCLGAIVRATATLFTEPSQDWRYVQGEAEQEVDSEGVKDIITKHRLAGKAELALPQWDALSLVAGSSVLLVGWSVSGEHLTYQVIAPHLLYLGYGDSVDIDGQKARVDWNDIEDATQVIIQLASSDDSGGTSKAQYLAIYGVCDLYPYGRYVIYRSSDPFSVPDVDATNGDIVEEYTYELGPANPLTLAGGACEYPVTICYGKPMQLGTILPVDPGMYQVCREFDVSASRLLTAASDGARGTIVLGVTETGSGGLLPRTVRGVVSLPRGGTYQITGHEAAAASQTAWELLLSQIECYGETSANIGGFELTPDTSRAPESGFALAIRAQPKKVYREQRIANTRDSVARLFEIEVATINYLGIGESIPEDTRQIWDPGELSQPEDPTAEHALNKVLLDDGSISFLEYIRREHDLDSIDEAKEFVKTMEKENAEHGPPKKEAPPMQQGGLGADLRARLQAKRGIQAAQ